MKETIYLLQYNNYFNRRVLKAGESVEDYSAYIQASQDLVNFDPKDGVFTSIILNTTAKGDYVLVEDEDHLISSRWFVLEQEFVRQGQYRLSLKRDVIADNLESVKDAPIFIEKATLSSDDPMLFNSENMTYNQIKKDEISLTDETGVPWIVGYMPAKGSITKAGSIESINLNSSGTATGTYTWPVANSISYAKVYQADHPENYKEWKTVYLDISFDKSTHTISYEIHWSAMAGRQVLIYFEYPVSEDVEVEYKQNIPEAIEATDLPWQFNPNATSLGIITSMEVPVTAVNTTYHVGSTYNYKLVSATASIYPAENNTFKARSLSDISSIVVTSSSSLSANPNLLFHLYFEGTSVNWGSVPGAEKTALRSAINYGTEMSSTQLNSIKNVLGLSDSTGADDLSSYNNKIIHFNNKYYRITVGNASVSQAVARLNHDDSYVLSVADRTSEMFNTYSGRSANLLSHDATVDKLSVKVNTVSYSFTATEIINDSNLKVTIPADDMRTHLVDAPYDMFCLPYKAIQIADGTYTSPDACLQIAFEMAKDLGTSKIYDIQLLPYCPVRQYISGTNRVIETAGTEGVDYAYIKAGGYRKVGIIFFASESNLTFDINRQISIQDDEEDEALKLKISNECDLYRMVSPNYSGQFEFSVAKNGGTVEKFNVDLTYKPYNPYIHVNPAFSGLYGIDYNDARGLLLGGDFSLPIISDAWTDYQVNNKNYQEVFDRQIQHMDVVNNMQNMSQSYNIAKTISGKSASYVQSFGDTMNGGTGKGMGSASWGLTTGITDAVINSAMLKGQQQEARSYAVDNFNYAMGNIQALPYGLTKSSAMTYNNKLFPILEYYTCTDEEKEALKNKLKYDGMTVMKIGKINDLETTGDTLVRGRIIRLDIADDNHMANEIYSEISKGVYL